MKAIVVGKYVSLPQSWLIDVVEFRVVDFPYTSQDCEPVIRGLLRDLMDIDLNGALLFGHLPGQVSVCIHRIMLDIKYRDLYNIGVIVLKTKQQTVRINDFLYVYSHIEWF